MYITNKPDIAGIADKNSVNRIFIDLETIGKEERQGHVDSVKSRHSITDVNIVKNVLTKAQLLVRVNPLNVGTKNEVDAVVECGADLVMLPMYKTVDEVKRFIDIVKGRAKVMLLCETLEAAALASETAAIPGVDEMFIGLNDLHLARKMKFMFELLADGTGDKLCRTMSENNLPYGLEASPN
jgi:citrate lyase beta subunit